MLVGRSSFYHVLAQLEVCPALSADCEATGLRVYHGDRLFSIIISDGVEAWYFNFLPYADMSHEQVLGPEHLLAFKKIFSDPNRVWYMHNAKFDMGMLASEGIEVKGIVHCTKAIARVENNDRFDYSLEALLPDVGMHKDMAVDEYVEKNKLFTRVHFPGKAKKEKLKHYDKVPAELMIPYGGTDAIGTFLLGKYQEESIRAQDDKEPNLKLERPMENILHNERRLTSTVFRMEQRGVLIDKRYCIEAADYERARSERASAAFREATGRTYSASTKLFQEIFADQKENWSFTEKGNPSFDSDALRKLTGPVCDSVLELRDAKSRQDFYQGFLYHADKNGVVHPNFNPDGAAHGRFSSSSPNFQNLTNEAELICQTCKTEIEEIVTACPKCQGKDLKAPEFSVRKAIIPRPGFIWIMPDYDQMEFRFMLEQACQLIGEETPLVRLILGGMDPHAATAKVATDAVGFFVSRYEAKTVNFLTLYGGGNGKLAQDLGCTTAQAAAIRNAIFDGAPEIKEYIRVTMEAAEKRKFIVNWMGRRCRFAYRSFSYIAPNYHVSGGASDIVKVAMNRIDEYLLDKKSKMVMTVHDELPTEVHESEVAVVPREIKNILESVFVSKYLPLTTGMVWSEKSLGDKRKGFPA